MRTTRTSSSSFSSSFRWEETAAGAVLRQPRQQQLQWVRRDSEERARHRTDFEVLDCVGRGGFGTVYRVRNKVDSQVYALKSVRVMAGANKNDKTKDKTEEEEKNGLLVLDDDGGASSALKKVLREVQVLSSVNHVNVVRYFAAWVEKSWLPTEDDDDSFLIPSASISLTISGSDDHENSRQRGEEDDKPTCHLCQETYVDWEVSFEHWGLIDASLQPVNLCTECYKRSLPPHVDPSTVCIRERQALPPDHLFILMEYCDRTLLQAVRDDATRNGVGNGDSTTDEVKLWSYFAQCCQGLAHLHSKGFVHRDIKPSNVFVHRSGVVKIGDLGLARRADGGKVTATTATTSDSLESSDVGTYMYMAPEVKKSGRPKNGNSNNNNNNNNSSSPSPLVTACDVYSLGLLLVEIWSNFGTGMERVKVLSSLASDGSLPEEWEARYPIQAQLAKRMVASDPMQRPTCSQILQELEDAGLVKSQRGCSDSVVDQEVEALKKELKSKEREVILLRQLLDEHGIPYDHIMI